MSAPSLAHGRGRKPRPKQTSYLRPELEAASALLVQTQLAWDAAVSTNYQLRLRLAGLQQQLEAIDVAQGALFMCLWRFRAQGQSLSPAWGPHSQSPSHWAATASCGADDVGMENVPATAALLHCKAEEQAGDRSPAWKHADGQHLTRSLQLMAPSTPSLQLRVPSKSISTVSRVSSMSFLHASMQRLRCICMPWHAAHAAHMQTPMPPCPAVQQPGTRRWRSTLRHCSTVHANGCCVYPVPPCTAPFSWQL